MAIRSPYRTLEKRIPTAFGLGMTVIFGGWVEACEVSCFGRLSPAFLFRHGLRRATFPPGEGIWCIAAGDTTILNSQFSILNLKTGGFYDFSRI